MPFYFPHPPPPPHLHPFSLPNILLPPIPEFIFTRVQLDVLLWVHVTTDVSKPDIKASVSQDVSQAVRRPIEYPVSAVHGQTMLQEHDWLRWFVIGRFSSVWNPLEVEDEAILCGDVMLFNWVTSVTNQFTLKSKIKKGKVIGISRVQFLRLGLCRLCISHKHEKKKKHKKAWGFVLF